MKSIKVLEKSKKDLDKIKKSLSSNKYVGEDPLRGIWQGLEIPDQLIEEAKKEFSNPKIYPWK